jgi:hypothetical protein
MNVGDVRGHLLAEERGYGGGELARVHGGCGLLRE